MANDPDSDHPPPLIPDSDTDDDDNIPPLIRLNEDNPPTTAQSTDLPAILPLREPSQMTNGSHSDANLGLVTTFHRLVLAAH